MAGAIRLSLRPVQPLRMERFPAEPIALERLAQSAPVLRLSGIVIQQIGSAAQVPVRIDAPAAATWILPHSLGRIPIVQVHLASGEVVIADVAADSVHITVTLAAPAAGFVQAY